MRDFLHAIATRRRRLAVVTIVDGSDTENEAGRLDTLGVAALAVERPGNTMRVAARSTGSLPVLSLTAVADDDDALAARAYGADAVVMEAGDDFLARAKRAAATRMGVLALASDVASAKRATIAGAKAVLVRGTRAEVEAVVAALPPPTRVIAWVLDGDADVVRTLLGKVDAALVEPALHRSAEFASLQAEVDPA